MDKKKIAIDARRFVSVIESLDFIAFKNEYKDTVRDKVISYAFEVRAGVRPVMNAETMEEAEEIAKKLNSLVEPFVKEELKRLNEKVNQ